VNQAFVLFDRDGTLIEHKHHLVNPDLVEFKQDLFESLHLLKQAGFKFGMISNQSVIARGLATSSDVEIINSKISDFLQPLGIKFDFIYYCPHLPITGCKCRKPDIGLGLKAISEHQLDPAQSYMVGDQESDVLFGKKLGCTTVQLQGNAEKSVYADYHSETLVSAAKWILD
jgi:histidinol-phosphate phosphatase family protein